MSPKRELTFSRDSLGAVVALLKRQGSAVVADVVAALGCSDRIALRLLSVVSLPPVRESTSVRHCSVRNRYVLAPDYAARIDSRIAAFLKRAPWSWGPQEPVVAGPELWPSGDPTHFDTDSLGRIIYRGPIAPTLGARWSLKDMPELVVIDDDADGRADASGL